jgi:hypothetical protein
MSGLAVRSGAPRQGDAHFWENQFMRHLARFLCLLLLLAIAGPLAPPIHAQGSVRPSVAITRVDSRQFPTVQLALSGDALTGPLGDLPVQVRENGQPQTIVNDQTATIGLQMAVVLDAHDLMAAGGSGQSRKSEVAGVLLDLIEQEVVVRNQDWLAVYSSDANGNLQTIQDWTGEPNLIFNSTVQTTIAATVDGEQLTKLLLEVLEQFQAPADFARVLLLFSAGSSQVDLEAAVARATEQQVRFHVVEMSGRNQQATAADALEALAEQTNGALVRLVTPNDLRPLWQRLTAARTQRLLTYHSNATGPAAVEVELTLPDGSPLTARADLNPAAAVLPSASTTNELAAPAARAVAAADVATAEQATTPSGELPVVAATEAPISEPEVENPATVAPLPANDTPEGGVVVVPGTDITLSRALLEMALPILLILLAFFAYREWRDRRSRRRPASGRTNEKGFVDSRHFALEGDTGDLQPMASRRAPTQRASLAPQDDFEVLEPTPPKPVRRPPVEEDDYDEATIVPTRFDDEEATYRLRDEIEQPVLGLLVRVSNDPNLPQQLPVYGLSPGPGEERKIHIGRHSKNNTVVINDKSISREHAVIIQKEGRLYLRDNASTAGTFLNWRRLKPGEELLLRHSDLISFGEIVYEFRTKGEDEATVASD